MNRNLIFILFFLLTKTIGFGQDYFGVSKTKYQILLRIEKDSSVSFIYSLNQELYAENIGKIYKIKDSLYHISAKMTLGNDLIPSLYTTTIDTPTVTNDTDYFQIDTPFVKLTDTVIIKYSNEFTVYFRPFDNQGNKNYFVLDKKLFNEKNGFNYYIVNLPRINKITGKPISFKLGKHTDIAVEIGHCIDFDVIIKNDKLRTIDGYGLITGEFKLKRKTGI